MTLDYQEVHEQIQKMGEAAPGRARRLAELRQRAGDLLSANASEFEGLRQRVRLVLHNHDANLRCALPAQGPDGEDEALDGRHPLPPLPKKATILAADGSQINPDRHAAVNFSLINIGAIQMQLGSSQAAQVFIDSQLLYDEELYTPGGIITDARLALMRDLKERSKLADLVEKVENEPDESRRNSREQAPVVTFTDGPMELWGARDAESGTEFQKSLEAYLAALRRLERLKVVTAGYVDKPAANLVVRLLEIASLPEGQLSQVRETFPLRGVSDLDLYRSMLKPGERSAIFGMQSNSAASYPGELALHFFYLNVGRAEHPWLARVEVPAWVVSGPGMLDHLHAILAWQCQMLGNRHYPYLLHRAHEAALVTFQEKEQVSHMVELELRKRGVEVGEASHKQALKDLPGKTAYER
jgi:hypothetical protein